MEAEEKLSGGSMSSVSKVGGTVRRQAGPWSAQVQRLLGHLRTKGLTEVPEPLGFDEQGREILSFIPGQVGHAPLPEALRSDEVLASAARLLRRIHDASQELVRELPNGWQAATRPPLEVICHGDFAPYNCVFDQGQLVGVIDFDHAHPGSRAWDLAYALYRFASLTDPSNPEHDGETSEQCRRARLFCDAYGLTERAGLVKTIQARVAFMADSLYQGAARGDPRFLSNIQNGDLAIYTTDHAHLLTCENQLRQALG